MSIRALRSLHKNPPEVKADEHILHFRYIHPSSTRPLKQPLAVKHSLPTANDITGHAYLEQVFSETYLPDGSFVFFRHVHKYASDNELLLLFLKRYSAAPTSLRATFRPASFDNSICIHHVAVFAFTSSGVPRSISQFLSPISNNVLCLVSLSVFISCLFNALSSSHSISSKNMAAFPSLDNLATLRNVSSPPDTDNRRTVFFYYIHPDFPFPLRQLLSFELSPQVVHHPRPWISSFLIAIQQSAYQPAGAVAPTLACLAVDEVGRNTEIIMLLMHQGPPYAITQCNIASTCTRTTDTCYSTTHAFGIAIDSQGHLRDVDVGDQWVVWNWFRSLSDFCLSWTESLNPADSREWFRVLQGHERTAGNH
ncbi:MAG: hypothetical protein NXY57DRAFT_1042930 [Lentinula lateritia]|nr:MAG: hypothetical protein NXY57DRAFT_1042930 [Lentinula lateritia]